VIESKRVRTFDDLLETWDGETAVIHRERESGAWIFNAGAAIALVGLEQLGWSKSDLDAALARIGETLREIYARADEQGISTAAAADVLAQDRLKTGG
jgi:hypothetical protein